LSSSREKAGIGGDMMNVRFFLLVIGFLFGMVGLQGALDWPQWRGPDGMGHAPGAKGLPQEWDEGKNVSWRRAIPGNGHSSPVIAGKEIWLTTAHETPEDPQRAKERLKKNTGGQPLTLLSKVELFAVCVDKESGKIVEYIKLMEKAEPQWVHKLNSYASPSPIADDKNLYCHFGSFGTAALERASGKVLWTDQSLRVMHENGPGSSPVLFENLLILHFDGSDEQFVVALDKQTGKEVWRVKRSGTMNKNPQLKKAYGTPVILEIKGTPTVVSTGADWLYGYNARTGKELWKLNYGILGFSNVSKPVVGHGMIYFSTCFMKGNFLAVKYEGVDTPEIVWKASKGVPKMPSPILVGDEVYYIDDKGIASCLDAHTGEVHWMERVGGEYSASPTFADGKLYFPSQYGKTLVIKPGKKLEILAENELDGKLMASFAVADNALFVRTDKALYRIEE
jgi:outer membrane protein assembly factor BamB